MGSSPRMRGTPRRHASHRGGVGIIPAYAGNTITLSAMHEAYWDHPRVCGEHATGASTQVNCTGSSPRMRGTPVVPPAYPTFTGIIPAYAGNTVSARMLRHSARDHPRICGEHIAKNLTTGEVKGSSPHMRGTRIRPPEYARTLGIIPAYAGNTPPCPGRAAIHWDHPRICGEHVQTADCEGVQAGSSPHMRGTPGRHRYRPHSPGIIPAYAGNTQGGYVV